MTDNPDFSSGTGNFNTFVEIQHSGTEQGYNGDARPAQFDAQTAQQAPDHSILLAQIPIVIGDGSFGTADGVAYREFLLDLNESNGDKSFLSLDALQLWQEESGSLTGFTPGTGFSGAHTNYLAYNLDAGGDHWVALNAGLSSGSGKTDVRILIPNSDFINDAAHRFVVLYSAFGLQGDGWASDGGFEEWGLATPNGPGVATPALAIAKTASVPTQDNGTADRAGEVISYLIKVDNVGNTTLTGLTVTDPAVNNLAAVLSGGFNIGDVNHDGQFNAGETWQYTASHTVTQTDLDTLGGGEGVISNTATAASNQTSPQSATVSIPVVPSSAVQMTKTPDVTSVDTAGNVINYAITVANTGTSTLTNPLVTDPQITHSFPILDFNAPIEHDVTFQVPVLVGDYNAGDTNQNGIQDPGETFQFTTITESRNVGDTNNSGFQDPGETFQFYNAGDTNHNGVQDPGETFQFNVDHNVAGVMSGGFNAGDTNHDGAVSPGETWQYAVSYTLTQADIDNGGVVDPNLAHNNTATVTTSEGATTSASAAVLIDQDPHATLAKAASVADGTADAAGDVINYTIAVTNDGNMSLTSPLVSDPSVSNLAPVMSGGFNAGDTNQDGKVSVGETWQYTASHTVTQADIDNGGVVDPLLAYNNTATFTDGQNATASGSASVPIVQNPHATLAKAASVADGTADAAGDVINYTIAVTNDGNMSLTSPVVSDPSVSNLAPVTSGGFNAGDTNHDGKVSVGETWQYTANHTLTQADIDNGGVVDPNLTYNNTATFTDGQNATASGSASVPIVQNPHVELAKAASVADGTADAAGDVINYTIAATNDGNMSLTNPTVSDPSVSNLAYTSGDTNNDGQLSVGETWHYTASHTVTQSDIDNGGVVNPNLTYNNTATFTDGQNATASASASVPIVQNPHVTLAKAGTVADGSADTPGDVINYTIAVHNDGNMTLTNPVVTDPSVNNLAGVDANSDGFNDGDTNLDGKLSVNETWQYTASHTVTQSDLDGGSINNTATVTTHEGATASGSASVPAAQHASMTLSETALGFHDTDADGDSDGTADAGDTIDYSFMLTNTGNVTQTNIGVSDPAGSGSVAITGGPLASLAPGASDSTHWHGTHVINNEDVGKGYFENEAVANSDEGNAVTGTVHVVLADLHLLV